MLKVYFTYLLFNDQLCWVLVYCCYASKPPKVFFVWLKAHSILSGAMRTVKSKSFQGEENDNKKN